jgi:hypothetical protein
MSGSPWEGSGTATTCASPSRSAAASVARTRPTGVTPCGGAGAGQREQEHRPAGAGPVDQGQVLVGERCGDGHREGAGVPLAGGGGGEVQPPEGSHLVRSKRLDRAVVRHPGQRQALGVDQLDAPGLAGRDRDLVRQDQRHRPGCVEPGARGQPAVDQQLEVVQLARAGAVLRQGHGAHRATHRVVELARPAAPVVELSRPDPAGRACRDRWSSLCHRWSSLLPGGRAVDRWSSLSRPRMCAAALRASRVASRLVERARNAHKLYPRVVCSKVSSIAQNSVLPRSSWGRTPVHSLALLPPSSTASLGAQQRRKPSRRTSAVSGSSSASVQPRR